MRKAILSFALLLLAVAAVAQGFTGGITATVVNRSGRLPIEGAKVVLTQGDEAVASVTTGPDGKFGFSGLDNGSYTLSVEAEDFVGTQINVLVEKGFVRDLVFVTLSPSSSIKEDIDDSNFAEFDLTDTGYSDAPTILFGSNDVYSKVAGYGFSAVRFKNRGYNSETEDVYLAGVKMNDALTGYSPYSLWSGLNEAMRSKDTAMGLETSEYGVGGFNGMTNISGIPSSVRPGWRFSVLSNSALYRLRVMANYASGQLDNGWSYAFNVSARVGGNDWVKGVYYKSLSFYGGVEKKITDEHRLALIAFATPGERGAQNASTQEVYDLMGDNMYNSNWGYQNGKVRNSRVRRTFEPVIALKYDFTPSDGFSASATALYRTGKNGYTALDWYDAMDPRPDYYRNLPSYSYFEDEDYNRSNDEKAAWATEMWNRNYPKTYANYQHLNWDRLYNVNYNNKDGRSKYALEERHVDQNDLNFAGSFKWRLTDFMKVNGGLSLKWNRTENYKSVNDLLGGRYYLNVDQFAERDFAANEALIQNDLDFFLKNGAAQKMEKGGKYGYDYLAQIRRAKAWANAEFNKGGFSATVAASLGYESFWREGLVRKGLFAGLDDNGDEIVYKGVTLTSYDQYGRVITSKGKSGVSRFLTYSGKLGLAYTLNGSHRFSANLGYFNDAPTFNQAFISARTRNSIIDGLTTIKSFSTDVNYEFSANGFSGRITGYCTKIMDQTDVMSFYDDSQQSFTNFAMTGIDQRHMGIELGVKVPLFVDGLSASGVLSWGDFIYTSTPHMVQTVDNSAKIVREEDVKYWKSHPEFKKTTIGGIEVYDQDADGYIVKRQIRHHVPSTPQLAAELALNYRYNYWFFEVNGQYFAHSYLDMNPLYRTSFACAGGDGVETPQEIEAMASQEEFAPAFLLNASVGKSWYINRKYNIGFSLEVKNILDNRNVRTGGYEQTRLIKSTGKDRYYPFDPKYFYMQGANYMLNLYFRF